MAGVLTGTAPLFERFSLGNTTTLRGWNKYDLAPLAPGGHYTNVDSGQVNFTDPGNGCWYVATVLYEERNDGAYIADDWGNFSLRLSSGQGCMFSFSGNPLTISPGGQGIKRRIDNEVTVLPQPVSPTMPNVSLSCKEKETS